MWLYWEYYLMGIILLPGIIFAIYAQGKVSSTYEQFGRIASRRGETAAGLLTHLLRVTGYTDVVITKCRGHLSDHYDSRNKTIYLSESVYNSSSIAALGVACHEFGHMLQHKNGYAPFHIRQIIIPVTNFVSHLMMPLVIIGLFFNFGIEAGGIIGDIFLWVGIAAFGGAVIANLVTLPVEYNASRRAVQLLRDSVTLDEEELVGAKKVLDAAALTYVAALLIALLSLARFLLVFLRRRD